MEYDLRQYMEGAADNAPLFIEALYDAFDALPQQFPSLAVPDVSRLNRVFSENEAGWEINPPDLICRSPHPSVPVQVLASSFHLQAREQLEQSLAESDRLLSEGRGRLAVQEILWLLETVSTAFRGIDVGEGIVRGKYFNTIVADLKRLEGGDLRVVLEPFSRFDVGLALARGHVGLELGIVRLGQRLCALAAEQRLNMALDIGAVGDPARGLLIASARRWFSAACIGCGPSSSPRSDI